MKCETKKETIRGYPFYFFFENLDTEQFNSSDISNKTSYKILLSFKYLTAQNFPPISMPLFLISNKIFNIHFKLYLSGF